MSHLYSRTVMQCLTKTAFFISLPIILALAAPVWSGAWVPNKDEGYVKVAYTYYNAQDFFGDNGDLGEFTGQNVSYYGEHGLGGNIGIYGSVLYQDLEQSDALGTTNTSTGLGDAELGIRYQWQASPFVLSTSLLVKLPYLYNENDALPRGNGQEDIELRFLLGRSLNEYGYFGLEAGYRLRTDEPSDEFRYLLEYGININQNLYFRTKLDTTISVGNAEESSNTLDSSANLSLSPEFDIGKLELTAGWNIGTKKEWGIEFTYNRDVFGDNTIEGDGFQIGLTRVY